MDDDPFSGWGLAPVALADQPTLKTYLSSLSHPLSDYTFSQIFTWRNSLRIVWTLLDDHLCVFANGSGDLTLLLPPIGSTRTDRALRHAFELMDEYNAAHHVPDRSRVEYASEELLARIDRSAFDLHPMGHDYIYDTGRMIDLAGGDLKSKRQERGRFIRDYPHRVEMYDRAAHLAGCRRLLQQWKQHQDARQSGNGTVALKRQKESLAAELALENAPELGLRGMVVYVADQLRGFTFGESLSPEQASIVIEKTDLQIKGLAQFIFSEFCRRCWADKPRINVGDDWGIETLAWTKMSYRPVALLPKYTLTRCASVQVAVEANSGTAASPVHQMALVVAHGRGAHATEEEVIARPATEADLSSVAGLERGCFTEYALTKQRLQYLLRSRTSAVVVAETDGLIVGEGIALLRRHRTGGLSGRIYSLAVNPDLRGRHIGAKLLDALIAQMQSQGVRRIYLEVQRDNAAAIALYERRGFRGVNILPNYYAPGRDAVHMLCELPAGPAVTAPAAA